MTEPTPYVRCKRFCGREASGEDGLCNRCRGADKAAETRRRAKKVKRDAWRAGQLERAGISAEHDEKLSEIEFLLRGLRAGSTAYRKEQMTRAERRNGNLGW